MEKQKVLFIQNSDGILQTEGLWCIKLGDNYVIDNIPFIAKRVSLGDTVKVEYDPEDGGYYFDDFVAVSGNTTLRIYFNDVVLIEETRNQLGLFGCESEVFLSRKIMGVNVPSTVTYKPIKNFLSKGEILGKWSYEESCLAHEI